MHHSEHFQCPACRFFMNKIYQHCILESSVPVNTVTDVGLTEILVLNAGNTGVEIMGIVVWDDGKTDVGQWEHSKG